MKAIIKILMVFLGTLILVSCTNSKKQISNPEDYNAFLEVKENEELDFTLQEIKFWEAKYKTDTIQKSYLGIIASKYGALFQYTGDINDLYQSEKLLVEANKARNYKKGGSLRSLARNYIAQHRFKEALALAQKAFSIGEGRMESHKLLFDVQMELGDYDEALVHLEAVKDMNDYDYLIRLAKWNDHIGDLDTAITFMEKARAIAEKEDNKMLKVWSYSNIGDFYGHAGRIQDSYDSYLMTLKVDPSNAYALKGIAWIVFSHERNTTEAKRIIAAIEKLHHTPDFLLLKSEIAAFEGNNAEAKKIKKAYFDKLAQNNYGAMYNKYNALIYADDKMTANKALEIATIEVDHRPTPDSYDLLAWAYLNTGEAKKALAIANEKVAGQSFEPRIQYHLAMIYKANNQMDKIPNLKKELEESIYELGPEFEAKIKQL
jgi:Tfp pilus assembly protein PilF